MKNILKLLFLLFSAAAPSWGYGFYEAATSGHISWSGAASSGYTEAKITVRNNRSYSVDVDFCTATFVQANTSQRIGLSYEKSTGSYYLRLAANRTYTLYFSSRCLDQSRSSPTTGVSFASCSGIGSQFSQIITALRNRYTQSSVWAITDSGSLSAAWKASDPRYQQPPPPASRIDLSGSWSSRISGSYLNITAGRVDNYGSYTSGTLRLRVVASRTRYTGGTLTGYTMGTSVLGQLNRNSYWSNIARTVAFTRPPSGTYWTVMLLEEYTTAGYVIRDFSLRKHLLALSR